MKTLIKACGMYLCEERKISHKVIKDIWREKEGRKQYFKDGVNKEELLGKSSMSTKKKIRKKRMGKIVYEA